MKQKQHNTKQNKRNNQRANPTKQLDRMDTLDKWTLVIVIPRINRETRIAIKIKSM